MMNAVKEGKYCTTTIKVEFKPEIAQLKPGDINQAKLQLEAIHEHMEHLLAAHRSLCDLQRGVLNLLSLIEKL